MNEGDRGRQPAPTTELKRLRWRCRRGMRELDAILEAFVARELASLDERETAIFARILDLPDPELRAYLVGNAEPEDRAVADVFDRIRRSAGP